MAAASSLAWRMLKASMIWEKLRNNAKNPTQNKIRMPTSSDRCHPQQRAAATRVVSRMARGGSC